MAGQGLLFRAINAVSSRILLNNRIFQINTPIPVVGLKHATSDKLHDLEIPEKPKRPLTAYFRFVQTHRQSLQKKHPDLKVTEIIKKCAEDWRNADPSIKTKFQAEFKEELAVYAAKFVTYQTKLTDDQKLALKVAVLEKKALKKKRVLKKKMRENEKPKRPIGAYMLFVMEHAKKSDKTFPELLSDLKEKWRNLPDSEKEKYVETSNRNKETYDQELAAWETKMIQEGKEDLVRKSVMVEKTPSRLKVKKDDKA